MCRQGTLARPDRDTVSVVLVVPLGVPSGNSGQTGKRHSLGCLGSPPRCAVRELWPGWIETQTRLSELSLLDDTINTKITFTVKPVLSGHSKIDKIKF